MRIGSRFAAALLALSWCIWAEATQVRHFAGTPSRSLDWLFLAPAIGCLITLAGIAAEPGLRRPPGLARAVQFAGFLLLSWRSIWMFFSWDGSFLFPAWLLLSLALYRTHARWIPVA